MQLETLEHAATATATAPSIREWALVCLSEADPTIKLEKTAVASEIILREGSLATVEIAPIPADAVAGRPARPALVAPRELIQRKLSSIEGRIALIHAVAHIEFNAINLAWDAVYRYAGLPADYYQDWTSVAIDEARHFRMLQTRLSELGCAYGDLPAHDGLWSMAIDTADDLVARMAMVPRVLEARGLDVTPPMIQRLRSAGDHASADILEIILREEVRHVAIGTRWFNFACARRGLDPKPTFLEILKRFGSLRIRGPFNHAARLAAGFDAAELAAIEQISQQHQSA